MSPEQSQDDPYGFITNPDKPARRQINFGNTPQQRMIIAGAGLVILIMIFIFLFLLFSRASNTQKDNLVKLAQTQTEIVRITEIAEKESGGIDTRSFAVNTRLSLQSDLQETTGFLAGRGVELKGKSLGLVKDENTDKKLEEASANNRFDETFIELLRDQLQDYRVLLQQAYEDGNSSEKQAMSQNYEEIALLL
jgi:hypothetical protein